MGSLSFKNELMRKAIHACNSIIAFSLYILDKYEVLLIVGISGSMILLFDYLRLNNKSIKSFYNSVFGKVTRDFENRKLTGASYVMIGAFIVLFFFETKVCIPALLIMSFSDTAAALVGKLYGKTKIFDKSLEGSFAFFVVSFIIVLFFIPEIDLFFSLIAITVVTIIELVPKYGLDDNFLIPVISAFIISIGG